MFIFINHAVCIPSNKDNLPLHQHSQCQAFWQPFQGHLLDNKKAVYILLK